MVKDHTLDRISEAFDYTLSQQASIKINAQSADYLLKRFCWQQQRALRPIHVAMLADAMRRGDFFPTPLLVGHMGDPTSRKTDPKLMDGQHRLSAVVVAEAEYEFPVVHYYFGSDEAREQAYRRVDRGASRDFIDTAGHLRGECGLSNKRLNKMAAAIKLIYAFAAHGPFTNSSFARRSNDIAAEQTPHYAPIMAEYCSMVEASPMETPRWAMNMAPVACVLLTMDVVPDTARFFWRAMLGLEDVPVCHPARTFERWLQAAPAGNGQSMSKEAMLRFVSAWNAYIEERELKIVRAAVDFKMLGVGKSLEWFSG